MIIKNMLKQDTRIRKTEIRRSKAVNNIIIIITNNYTKKEARLQKFSNVSNGNLEKQYKQTVTDGNHEKTRKEKKNKDCLVFAHGGMLRIAGM